MNHHHITAGQHSAHASLRVSDRRRRPRLATRTHDAIKSPAQQEVSGASVTHRPQQEGRWLIHLMKSRVLPVTRRIRFSRIVASSVAYPYAERHRALGTAVAMVGSWLFVCDLD